MRIEFDGTTYDYDQNSISIDALIVIKDFTGYNYQDWVESLDTADPRSLRALWWHIRRQTGVVETIAAAPQAEAGASPTDPTEAPVAVPTGASTPIPAASDPSTSSPSPISAA